MAPSAIRSPGSPPTLSKLGIPSDSQSDQDSKVASPTDSENAEKEMASLEETVNGKLQIKTENQQAQQDPLMHDAVQSANSPPDFSNDPLSATALISPLHGINWDAVSAFQPASLNSFAATALSTSSIASATNWEAFKRTGPIYPPSLEKMIMDYHHKNSKSWQLSHDMGSGSGLYSPVLAKYFRHVHISDPNTNGLGHSRQAMTAWSAEHKKSRGRFTFSAGKPEDGHIAVADRTVDLAIMLEGAHFTNADAMVRSAAQSLAPHGTLAFVSYHPVCHVFGNPAANEAVQRLFTAWGSQPYDVICGEASGKRQFSLGLDFISIPDDLFDTSKTRRITINTQGKGSAAFQVPTAPKRDASDSRVRSDERVQDFSSEHNDKEATGWRQDVGAEFFRSLTAALAGGQSIQQFEQHFKDIQKIIFESSPNGITITVEWTVAIVLATRR